MIPTDARPDALNFVITGQVRCGGAVIQTSVASHPQAVAHGDLLHEEASVRRRAHEDYFGPPADEDMPECWMPYTEMSPEQYLTERVFDNNQRNERAIGVKLLYSHLNRHQLWEYFHSRCLSGDFCVIHITRNPIACYVSMKQAEQSGVWHQAVNDKTRMASPSPVSLEVSELVPFVRWHAAHELRVKDMCDDRLELEYRELFLNYREVMRGVFEFLELPPYPFVTPGIRRLKNRNIKERVQNWSAAYCACPSDVREFFDRDDLF